MNALQHPPDPDRSPVSPRRSRVRARAQQHRSPHQALVSEIAVKFTVNLIVIAVAAGSLLKLVPYNIKQEADLKRLKTEVAEANHQVEALQADFDRHFDPQQALNVMQEQNIRFNPKQKQVVWLTPEVQKAESPEATRQAQSVSNAPD